MSPRRKRSGGPGVALALLALALLIFGVHGSSAFAAEDNEVPKASKSDEPPQVEDTDRPKDKSLLARQPADEAVAKKNEDENLAFYQKWQFWAITGGIAVGLVAAIWGGITLYHSVNGGDVRPCATSFIGCYGQGENQ
jgi:hypothetical protein